MSASAADPDWDARMFHFRALDHALQAQAIRRLATAGHTDHTIARATGLSVEMVQRILADQEIAP
jgi:hypothetical protein